LNIDCSVSDTLEKLRLISNETSADVGDAISFKKTVVFIGTPNNFLNFTNEYSRERFKIKFHTVVLDKVDMLQ